MHCITSISSKHTHIYIMDALYAGVYRVIYMESIVMKYKLR